MSRPDPAAPPVPPVLAPRWANLDRLRILAIIDIVAYHANFGEARFFGGIGLPLFLIAAVFLPVQRKSLPSWSEVIRPRLRRIGIPWVFWSVLYGLYLPLRERVRTGTNVGWSMYEPEMIFYGTAAHLWFLPFIFLAALATRAVLPFVRAAPWRGVVIGGLALSFTLACVSPFRELGYPFKTWWFSLPGVVLGITLGRWSLAGRLHGAQVAVLGLIVAAGAVVWLITLGLEPPVGRFALAGALVVLAVTLPLPDDSISRKLASCVYGIYLIHPLVFLIYEDAFHQESYASIVAVGLLGSLVLTLGLQRTPGLRAVV